jgi:short-subunit dehydrogenase
MSFPYTGTAVVTGAGSGIGRALAHGLAGRGLDLALVDIHQDRLDAVRGELTSNTVRVTTHRLDVADREAVRALPGEVAKDHPAVSLLFNNAGVGLGGMFEDLTEADFDWLMDINFRAVVDLTRAFLPVLKAAPKGRVVNVSSIFGVIAPPGQTAYCAAKFAVKGFSESLRHELEAERSSVGVTVVHPGGVATRISDDARVTSRFSAEEVEARRAAAKRNLVMPPPQAAEIVLRAVERGKGRVLVGNDARLAETIQRLMPAGYYRLVGRKLANAT